MSLFLLQHSSSALSDTPAHSLLDLLEKGKSNESESKLDRQISPVGLTRLSFTTDHASVINIASVAAFSPLAESGLAAPGQGTWSCE